MYDVWRHNERPGPQPLQAQALTYAPHMGRRPYGRGSHGLRPIWAGILRTWSIYLRMLGSRQGFWEYALRMRGTRQGVWEYTTYMIGSKQGFWEYAYFGGVHFKTGTKKKVLCPVYTCQHLQIKQSDRMMQDGGRAGKMPSGHESSSWAYIYTCIYIYIYIRICVCI
jgi:hypothetical protein